MGVRMLYNNSAQVLADFQREVTAVLELGATITQQEAVRAIQTGGRSGRIYIRGGRAHQASARGEAPASDTTRLEKSIQIERPSPNKRRVVVGEHYGAILELRKGRPFLLPAFYRSVPAMRSRLRSLQSRRGWRSHQPLRRQVHYSSTVRPRARRTP